VFAGVGTNDRRSVGALVVVVACDTVVVIVLDDVEVALVLVAVPELGELLHAVAAKPMAIAAAANALVVCFMLPPWHLRGPSRDSKLAVEPQVFAEALHTVDLVGQRGVRPGVEHPRHDDDAGDPGIRDALIVGGGESVGERRQDGEII
jgi:hypothetical protein